MKNIMNKKDIREYIKKSKWSILIVVLFILLSFGQRLISSSYSIDVEHYIHNLGVNTANWTWWNSLSRWGLVMINKLALFNSFPIYASNYLAVITMIIYSFMFNYLFYCYIKEDYEDAFLKYQFIFPIIFVTSPIFAEQYNFIHQSFGVALGILMIPVSIIIIDRASEIDNKYLKLFYYLIGISITVLCFGVYQSIILLYIVTVASCYLLKVIKDKDNNWMFLLKKVIIFLISILLYLTISKVVSESSSYLNMAWKDGNILQCLKNIYYCIKDIIISNSMYYNIGYIIALILTLVLFINLIVKKEIKIGMILGAFAILTAPFYIMIITGEDQLKRTQFNYSYTIGFILMIVMVFIQKLKKKEIFSIIGLAIVIYVAYIQSYISSNLFYTSDVVFQNDIIIANKIVSEIENKEWYDSGTEYELIIIGAYTSDIKNVYIKGEIIGYSFFDFDYENAWGVSARANIFINNLGYKFKQATTEDFYEAKKYVEENSIKSWPSKDSIILMKENKIVVRLSESL